MPLYKDFPINVVPLIVCRTPLNLRSCKYFFFGIFCGLAALFQPLIGLQVASIIGIVLLVNLLLVKQNNISLKNVFTYSLAFISIALFIFIPVLLTQLNANNSNQMEANKILFEYRGALHYLPQLFPF